MCGVALLGYKVFVGLGDARRSVGFGVHRRRAGIYVTKTTHLVVPHPELLDGHQLLHPLQRGHTVAREVLFLC